MSVIRFDPFRDYERLSEQLFGRQTTGGPRSFPMDAYRRGERFYVHLDLPGVEPDTIELTSEQNVLTIKAERRFHRHDEDEIVVQERPQGSFSRQLFVSEALDLDQIEASYEHGVLTITIPVAEQAKPRRIQISRSEHGPEAIEGSAARTDR
jgi:HSP20 family protein